MIQVHNLVKWYGPILAVDDLSFEIPAGQIVGFLGPNGAGKSTTLRMLTGFLPPTSGQARLDGIDVLTNSKAARQRIGYLPESTPLYLEMKVDEYLHYRGKLMGMSRSERNTRINAVTDRCGLSHNRRRVIGNLSKGNRQRVGIAQALLHDPPVLILDEPTSGLDPNQIGEVRKLIRDLGGDHTILLSSHILPEVERSADRVMIIAGGRIVADGIPDDLRHNIASDSRTLVVEVKASREAAEKAIRAISSVATLETTAQGGWIRIVATQNDDADLRERVGQVVQTNHWQLRELRYETASLEQMFVRITAPQHSAAASGSAA